MYKNKQMIIYIIFETVHGYNPYVYYVSYRVDSDVSARKKISICLNYIAVKVFRSILPKLIKKRLRNTMSAMQKTTVKTVLRKKFGFNFNNLKLCFFRYDLEFWILFVF